LVNKKKILSLCFKTLLGCLCFYIIYYKLKSEFTPERLPVLRASFSEFKTLSLLVLAILLMPLNWGIEALKWQRITDRVEAITYKTANQSVYAGVFAGNFAPGRATEFLAKILFFKKENRPTISVLHFLNGMFQLLVTVVFGITAFIMKAHEFSGEWQWLRYSGLTAGALLLVVFVWCMLNIQYILKLVYKRLLKKQTETIPEYKLSLSDIRFLIGFSILRYAVFASQFAILLLIANVTLSWEVFVSIAIYFFITTTIPMISFIEAAIRVAVALIVFKSTPIDPIFLAIVSVLLWVINIVLTSIIGYLVVINKKIEVSFLKRKTLH
jgi:hypothetical protein